MFSVFICFLGLGCVCVCVCLDAWSGKVVQNKFVFSSREG